MGRVSLILCFVYCIFQPLCSTLDQASFYGNSYISIPLKEAKSTTTIHFKFKTRLSDALLLFATGSNDHCTITLENGKLKVSIDLGGGEAELLSHAALNDFKWHDVNIDRRDANISMNVDKFATVSKNIPGRFFELNINSGLFVGGKGNDSDTFFGHYNNFRGCLEQVMYNGLQVLDRVRHRQSQATVQGVTWNCSSEFEVDANKPISFVNDDAFMVFPRSVEKSLKLQFEIKTILERSLVFYNTGQKARSDHFAIELDEGKIKVILKSNGTIVENCNSVYVSDGKWHTVSVRLTTTTIDLSVSSNLTKFDIPRGEFEFDKHFFDKLFYVGGLENSKKSRANSKGLKTVNNTFKGCLKHIAFSEYKIGLPDVLVSSGLHTGCVWEYKCVHKSCTGKSVCVQDGLDGFKCVCDRKDCKISGESIYTKPNSADKLELLSIEPLEVLEGNNTLVTTQNLHVTLDYEKYGIQEKGIKFQILQSPLYGTITNNAWLEDVKLFTLSDVAKDKVHYLHDGSEDRKDFIVMEVQFTADKFLLPSYLQGSFKFTLNVNVIPTNDPPVLNIPATSVLRIAQGSRKVLDSSLWNVTDPDTSINQLIYNTNPVAFGHFEYIDRSGYPITSFSQNDLNNFKVVFVDESTTNVNEFYLNIQVSDGIETSPVGRLRVITFPQYWRLQNNTGLILLHESFGLLTPYNLSFVSNVPNTTENAEYTIVQSPQFGEIEVEKNGGIWEISRVFNSEDLRQHRVRYRHMNSLPDFDEFQFQTSLNKTQKYSFRLSFAKCKLIMLKNAQVNLNLSKEVTIGVNNLHYQTQPVNLPTTSIKYVIITPPVYGYLFWAVSEYKMTYLDTFSQEDVISQNIKYKLHQRPYSEILDLITYSVLTPGCKNVTGNITISYVPPNDTINHVKVLFKRLKVEEGGRVDIGMDRLSVEINFVTDLVFNVTKPPNHGYLQITKQGILDRNKTEYFTLKELKENQLSYVHDNSETKYDNFKLMVLSLRKDEDFQYVENFHIDVSLKNDNSPLRAFEKKFYVVENGEKLLTNEYLLYTDKDIDTKPSDIVYTWQEIPNGDICNALTKGKISRFTQEDLNAKNILFKHKGHKFGRIQLWVTDGQNHVNGILEVEALGPFLWVYTHKKVIVKHGGKSLLMKDHLNYATNLFADDGDVVYEVTIKPRYGRLIFGENNKEVLHFTQLQINSGKLLYVNDITSQNADEITLRVRCLDAINTTQIRIQMLPAGYWDPLVLKTSNQLVIEESTSAPITNKVLEIYQTEVPPSSIVYYIAEYPLYGYITMLASFKFGEENTIVRSFTQSVINEGRLVYVQSAANETQDRILFNVTNGMVSLLNVVLDIQIIPDRIYLGTNTLNVSEGGLSIISIAHLFVLTDYYKSKISEYVLLELPKYGCILVRRSCTKWKKFTNKDLKSGLVSYKHDDSENLLDEIKVSAISGGKRSETVTLPIVILPKNDQKPIVVNNTGLTMWEGGVAVITNTFLAAEDADRPLEVLKYQVLGCWWGNVSLISQPDISLQYFTQELINMNMIVFRHLNGSEAKFTFNVTDGLHSTKEYTFYIKTKQVRLKVKTKPLHIFPFQKKYITPSYILSTISDESRMIYYEITTAPRLGRLVMETEHSVLMVSNFTQSDLNSTRIYYEQTLTSPKLYSEDSFTFNVKSHLAETLYNERLSIDISVSSGGLDAYVEIPRNLSIDEGGMTPIILNLSDVAKFLENHANEQSPNIYGLVMCPQHGQIYLKDNKNVTTNFTRNQLETGQVVYVHDHSDSLGDNIYFSFFLLPKHIMLCNVTVPIKINPKNDQVFHLVTGAPRFSVVQGHNHTISRHELYTEDLDTSANELKYEIVTEPREGLILLLPEIIVVNVFTQEDINHDKVVYVHNGNGLSDTIHFRVSDGYFQPTYAALNIQIIPVYLNATSGVPIFMQQVSSVVHLTENQFIIDTNADKRNVKFYLRSFPRHGGIYLRDINTTSFEYEDVLNRNVMYMQFDMTAANDSFDIYVGISNRNISEGKTVTVKVIIQPLMQIGNFTALTGMKTRLTLKVLDATPLAKMTNTNPSYKIITKPKYGEIRKIIRSSGEHRNTFDTVVNGFTHAELQSGYIYYVLKNIEVGWNGIQDKIEFTLGAGIFQPAVGELKINIRSSASNDIVATRPGPEDPAGHEGDYNSSVTRDYFFIVSMIAGVVLLGILIVIVVKCRSMDSEPLNKEEQCLQPIPLPRPPDRLMAASPPLKDGFSSPLLTALPQCKVTPINRNDVDIHGRYPYGVDEPGDEWSSCDASDPACPSRNIMLRRNQYWV
ncbi:chondroitin sulfate proteoglycan 4 isoform X2 [Onthophagus taurus]|uniref:chondroitin sulfate proteoglycan 4 isoform X2 n=1 Tax=Onthophagus taurus TaxID=166361 RepID=UPI0039BDC390